MTEIQDVHDPDLPSDPPARRRALVVATALILIVCGAGWWTTHPQAFDPAGNGEGAQVMVGETRLLYPVVLPKRGVKIISVRPHNEAGTPAKVSLFACVPNGGLPYSIVGGSNLAPTTRNEQCKKTRLVGGTKVGARPNPSPWVIAMEIELLGDGLHKIHGFEVTYWDGVRFGRQVTGMDIDVFTEGHKPND